MKRKICVFTGSRAEYGILSDLMKSIDNHPQMELQVVATNMHLSPEFGMTVKEIEKDGFKVDKRVEMLLSSDTAVGTVKSVGVGMMGFADALEELRPDIVLILGDRYEMLGVAQSALLLNIPIAHLHGGEITEGAYDEAIRHAITKLSLLHFTSTEEYRQNVIQMGEHPDRVFNVGALGVENISNTEFLSAEEVGEWLEFDLGENYLVATYHPVTAVPGEAKAQTECFIRALEEVMDDVKILITLPNSDAEGREITKMLKDFESTHPARVKTVKSLGRRRYYSAVKHSRGVIGNSSSGLLEAPSLGVPTLNIGDRQKGRARGRSVIDVPAEENAIRQGLRQCLSEEMRKVAARKENPYQGRETLQRIITQLATAPLGPKQFYKIPDNRKGH